MLNPAGQAIIDVAGEMLEEFSEADYPEFNGDADNEPWIERPATLFHVGNYGDKTYTPADMQSIVDTFQAPAGNRWTVPIQRTNDLGKHSQAADATSGGVRAVWTDGKTLFGRLRFVGQEAVRKVKSGLWQKLSAGLYTSPVVALREVTVTPFPRVGVAAIHSEGGPPPMNKAGFKLGHKHGTAGKPKMSADELKPHAEKGGEGFAESYNEGHDEGAADAKGSHKEPDGDEKTVGKEAEGEKKGEKMKAEHSESEEIKRVIAEFSERTKRLEEENAVLMAEREESRKVAHFSQCTAMVETFSQEGKTLPTMRQPELDLIVTFSDEQMGLYKILKESQPKVVEFSRLSTGTVTVPPENAAAADAARAKDMAERYKPGWTN